MSPWLVGGFAFERFGFEATSSILAGVVLFVLLLVSVSSLIEYHWFKRYMYFYFISNLFGVEHNHYNEILCIESYMFTTKSR